MFLFTFQKKLHCATQNPNFGQKPNLKKTIILLDMLSPFWNILAQ